MFKNKSLLPLERFISLSSLGGKIFDSIIKLCKGLAVDYEFDEMLESLLGKSPLRGWRTYLFTCLIMEISERDSEAIQILDRMLTLNLMNHRKQLILMQLPIFFKKNLNIKEK